MQKTIKISVIRTFLILSVIFSLTALASNQTLHHQMEITLTPDTSEIHVTDQLSVPERYRNQQTPTQLDFSLHAGSR